MWAWLPLLAFNSQGLGSEIVLETIEEIPFDTDADLIGIGSMGHAVIRSIDIARNLKAGQDCNPRGYMVSLMAQEAKYCDSVVIGDGEGVWEQVIEDFEEGNLKAFTKRK